MIAGSSNPARSAAVTRVNNLYETPRPVEKGVTGKEKQFQQNRAFGPGAMKPYPYTQRPYGNRNVKSGVYYGKGIRGVSGPHKETTV